MKTISLKGASWDSVFLSFSKVLTLLLSILSAKILSTGLSLEDYGTYSQANLVVTVGTSIILLGMPDALNFYFNSRNGETSDRVRFKIINTVFFIEIILGLLFTLAVILGQDLIATYFSNPAVKYLLPIAAVLPLFANVMYFYQIMYVAVGRAKLMAVYSLTLTVVRIVAVYLSVYILNNLVWIYAAILCMDFLQVSIYHIELRKRNIRINPFRISLKHIRPIIAYGLPMGIYAITNSFTRDLDKLIIGRLGGTEQLAIYSNCSKILPLDFFVTSFAMVLIPYIYRRVSEGCREESVELFSNYLKVGYYTVWTLGTMVLIAPDSMISFLYSDVYVSGRIVFTLYILDSMLRFASVHLILTAAGKSKKVMFYSILSLGLNLVLNISFYYIWGMIGPAIATVIAAIVYTLLILQDTIKVIKAKWTEVFHVKEIAVFLTSLIVMWFVGTLLDELLNYVGLHQYISMFLSMAVFGVAILLLHFKKIIRVFKKINSFKL